MENKIYSVGELTRQIKLILEDSFPAVWVEGEISNFKPHYSGHLYFTLKDRDAQLSCVMWRSRATTLDFDFQDGTKIQVYGNLRLYEKAGRYQLDALRIQPAGYGQLQLQFDLLKQKLKEEGLFDSTAKKKLPSFPQIVGVITSPTGAALNDIISVIKRRSPSTRVIIYGVKVQGEGAAEQIAEAVHFFNRKYPVDVLILARGGGSLEDLWAFNEEVVARAIYDSTIPVVSAVGHEIDFTISDFVADLRAPTPTAGAELVFIDDDAHRSLLLELEKIIQNKILDQLSDLRESVLNIRNSYAFRRPKDMVQAKLNSVEDLTQRLLLVSQGQLKTRHVLLENFGKQLDNLNPQHVLNRGYSMVLKEQRLITSVLAVEVDDHVKIRLKDGELSSIISSKNYDKSKNV